MFVQRSFHFFVRNWYEQTVNYSWVDPIMWPKNFGQPFHPLTDVRCDWAPSRSVTSFYYRRTFLRCRCLHSVSSLSGRAPPRTRGSLKTPLRNFPELFIKDAWRLFCHRVSPRLCDARLIRFISSLTSFLMALSSLPAFAFRGPAGAQ